MSRRLRMRHPLMNPHLSSFYTNQVFLNNGIYKAHGSAWLRRRSEFKPTLLFPGISQSSQRVTEAKKWIVSNYKDRFTVESIHTQLDDVEKLLTDMDMPANLASVALDDNTLFREKYGCREPDETEINLARRMIRLIIKHSDYQSIEHKETSSSGAPFFITGQAYKKELVRSIFKDAKVFRDYHDAVVKLDKEYMIKNGMFPCYTHGERKHASTKGKVREYVNPEQWYRGKIQFEKVDFTHPTNPDLTCYDRRSVYALPSIFNIPLQILNNALMDGFKKVCPGVVYNGEVEFSKEVKSLPGQRVLFSLDKSKFGETFSTRVTKTIIEELKSSKFWHLANIFEQSLTYPYLYTGLRRGTYQPVISHDPWQQVEFENQTFGSGNGLVVFLNKFNGVLDVMLSMRIYYKDRFKLESALSGQYAHEIWFKNSGDDTAYSVLNTIYPKYNACNGIHKDVVEKYMLFLGYYYTQQGDPIVTSTRFLQNMLLNERTILAKSFPKIGVRCRIELYRLYGGEEKEEVIKLLNDGLLYKAAFDLNKWLSTSDSEYNEVSTLVKSDIDALFVENPDIIHYKIDAKQISGDLFRHFYNVTEPDEYVPTLEAV